jgi:glycosyltransferase involved in cell wall biosynthesis
MEETSTTRISVTIITFNEEKNIGACLDSVLEIADEIIVLDSFSGDKTEEIARSYPKVKFSKNPFQGHVEQKNAAIAIAKNEWILALDADERVDAELKKAILAWKLQSKSSDSVNGYKIARLTWHMGKFIRHSGWYPLRRYRFFRKSKSRWVGENPHDYITIEGKGGILPGNIIHYSFRDLTDQVDTINRFSSIVAFTRYQKNKSFSFLMAILKPWVKFLEIYFIKLGFMDGFPGFVIAISSAYSTFLKHAKLYELSRKQIMRPSNLRESYGKKEK